MQGLGARQHALQNTTSPLRPSLAADDSRTTQVKLLTTFPERDLEPDFA